MLPLLAILLAISTAAAPSPDIATGRTPAYERVWDMPPVPDGLPSASMAPRDGHWTANDGADGGAGTWLPEELSRDVLMRLEFCDHGPRLCQARLDWAKERCSVDVQHAVDVALADAGVERMELEAEPSGWPTWQVALLTVGAVVVGAAVGAGAFAVSR
jgi:hypothetical protein